MDQDKRTLRRERVEIVRRMQSSLLASDPMLDAMCENLAHAMGADAAMMTLLLEIEMVFIGTYGLRHNPKVLPRPVRSSPLRDELYEELRADENSIFDQNPMVHGPYDWFKSVASAYVIDEGVVVGGLAVCTRAHRAKPYDEAARAELFRARDAVQTHLRFGVMIRAKA